jgi:hypothetical protein
MQIICAIRYIKTMNQIKYNTTLLEFELLPWLVDIFFMINLGSTDIRRLARDAHHFCRQVHGRNLHGNKIYGI